MTAPGVSSAPPVRRIVHLTAPAPFGGLEQVVQTLAVAQHRFGHDVRVVVLSAMGASLPPLVRSLEDSGVRVVSLRLPVRAYAAQRAAIRALGASSAPDVLHTHGYHPDVLAALLGRRVTMARVSTVHGFTGGGWKNRWYERMQCFAYRRADAVVAVSSALRGDLTARGVPDDRIHVVPNAWSKPPDTVARLVARQRLRVPDGAFSVGWVGRISPEKGLDLLVDALPDLRDTPVHVTIVGDGPERERLVDRAATNGAEARITWCGTIPDAALLLQAFDAVVLTSRREGTPMILLEAMAAGVPIVATAVGGVPDVVSSAEAALVPSDDRRALAQAIRQLADAPSAARERARRASVRLARSFAVAPWIAAYDRVYRAARSRERGEAT